MVKTEIDGGTPEGTVVVDRALPSIYDVTLDCGAEENAGVQEFVDELGEVHLETREGDQIQATEYGTVSGDTLEVGQELVLKGDADGEAVDTVTVAAVDRPLPGEFIVDARLVDDGETVLDDCDTPYRIRRRGGRPRQGCSRQYVRSAERRVPPTESREKRRTRG